MSLISHHGQTMYALALEHAINMFEIAGEDALAPLKEKLAETRAEIEQEAEACND